MVSISKGKAVRYAGVRANRGDFEKDGASFVVEKDRANETIYKVSLLA